MIRVLALQLFLLVLPFILYAVYAYLNRQTVPEGEGGVFADAPLLRLAGIGLALVIVAFVAIAVLSRGEPDGVYVPAEVRDGKLIPGHILPKDPDAAGEPTSR